MDDPIKKCAWCGKLFDSRHNQTRGENGNYFHNGGSDSVTMQSQPNCWQIKDLAEKSK